MVSLENQSARDAATINTLTSEIRKLTTSIGDTNAELAKLKKAVSPMQFVLLQPLSVLSQHRKLGGAYTLSQASCFYLI